MRAILHLLVSHCGGSYFAAALALPISLWFGMRDLPGLLTVAAIAPVSLPAMAFESLGDWRIFHASLALLFPPYAIGFLFTLRLSWKRAWRRQRQARTAAGLCGACGYDLTCNTSGVCPECGRAT
jgi:hypothetical protein